MVQKRFWETRQISPEQREQIVRAVEEEVNRTIVGFIAWNRMRSYLTSHDVGPYMRISQQYPAALKEAYERLNK